MKDSKYLFGLAALLIVGAMTINSFSSVTSNPSSAQFVPSVKECITIGSAECNVQNLSSCAMGNCMTTVVFECTGRGNFSQKDCPIIGGGGPCTLQQIPFPEPSICASVGQTCNPDEIPPAGCSCDCPGPAIDEVVWSGNVTDSNGVSDEILVSASGQVAGLSTTNSCIATQLASTEKPLSCESVRNALRGCSYNVNFENMCGGEGGGNTICTNGCRSDCSIKTEICIGLDEINCGTLGCVPSGECTQNVCKNQGLLCCTSVDPL